MNKTDNTTNGKPDAAQLLQQSAEQLAQRHQQRLHQMTRQAVYGKAAKTPFWSKLRWPTTIAVPVLSLMAVVLVWQLGQQTAPPPSQTTLAQNSDIPAWVRDTEVPLAVLQNIEFYQWLENELDNPNHS